MATTPQRSCLRVFSVDDSIFARKGIRAALSLAPPLKTIGEAANKADAVSMVGHLKPDVVILDVRLPDGTGTEACRDILAATPDARILLLSAYEEENIFNQAIVAGAHGFLSKGIGAKDLLQAIKAGATGRSVNDSTETEWVLARLPTPATTQKQRTAADLSREDIQLLELLASGHAKKMMAEGEQLFPLEVNTHRSTPYRKLRVSRRIQAVHHYRTHLSPSKTDPHASATESIGSTWNRGRP